MSYSMKIYFAIMVFFTIVGILTVSTVVHEYSHLTDYKEFATEDTLCLYPLPDLDESFWELRAGHYRFSYNANDTIAVSNKMKTTEYKAYAWSTVIIMLGVVAVGNVWFGYPVKKKAVET